MDFKEIVSKTCNAGIQQFWNAMHIWLNNPHLVNRRISSSVNLLTIRMKCSKLDIIQHLSEIKSISEILDLIAKGKSVQSALNIADKCGSVDAIGTLETSECGVYLLVNKLLPRDSKQFSLGIEFTIVDKDSNCVLCIHRNENDELRCLGLKHLYRIAYDEDNRCSISVATDCDLLNPCIRWLGERLFPRLIKWIESDRSKDDALVEGSLNLVCPESYSRLYGELKQKYGSEMVKKWPECTDPNKFVYEDVAIAAYLMLLWEKERKENGEDTRKQSFLDLGCGNGLLVYILTSEGHSGMGIDLRKRQIWDIYPPTTRLEEQTIIPSAASLFPEVDWLIGNHSDELTPWIPVIAARSSYSCRFFLLPCCAHEFDGRKFQRDSAAKSQYFEYIKYIKSVSEGCGFKTDLDRLRIPSTKRICLIGSLRNYEKDKSNLQDESIQRIINARSLKGNDESNIDETSEGQWSRNFKARDTVERVRNCTQIDRTIIDEIIKIVASHLLRKVRPISIKDQPQKIWNAGGQVALSEIANIVPQETLKQLKKECGGLQTLLRNNSHIFRVVDGTVHFKVPGTEATGNKKKKKAKANIQTKVKPCWFHENHPDGCPLTDELCTFKH